MDNVSFGAHLSLQNNSLYKHVSRDLANEFAKGTKSVQGIMTMQKDRQGGIDFILNKCSDQMICVDADVFYKMNNKTKVSFLKRVARYMDELIKIDKINVGEGASKKELDAHIRKLDKIAGNDENFLWVHDICKDSLLNKVV